MLNAVEDTIENIASTPCDLTNPATQATFDALEAAEENELVKKKNLTLQ